jgi:DMSO/TMAO reductase YedYZ molybdopterin-dependent catalytic subunit
MVALHGFLSQWALIVLGETHDPDSNKALIVGLIGIAVIVGIHVAATRWSIRRPRAVQQRIEAVMDPLRQQLFGQVASAQRYDPADVSPSFWVNGRPPPEAAYLLLARDRFANYRLEVSGLVDAPLRLSLADLRAMPKQTQITKHCCIQGWSGVAEWGGVSLRHIVARCRPLPSARFILFRAYDNKTTSEPDGHGRGYFYGTIRIELANDPQTMLAYDMNDHPLPILHGAPLRLRVETQLGFTMVKYIRTIEFVDSYLDIGKGQGGWREDHQYFSQEAGI